MAPFLKFPLLTIFFLAMLLYSNPSVAREIKIPTTEAPTEAPAPSPSSTKSENYEYYGHETGLLPPQKEEQEDLTHEELGDNNNNNNNNNNNGNGYLLASENYVSGDQSRKNEDYGSESQGMSDTRFMETDTNPANDETRPDHEALKSQKSNYGSEKQGMSDTRFMEGGKYYFDVGGQQQDKARDGNTKSQRYVFDTMEEYEQYVENQHYVP